MELRNGMRNGPRAVSRDGAAMGEQSSQCAATSALAIDHPFGIRYAVLQIGASGLRAAPVAVLLGPTP